jgi:hypothetical protein
MSLKEKIDFILDEPSLETRIENVKLLAKNLKSKIQSPEFEELLENIDYLSHISKSRQRKLVSYLEIKLKVLS